MIARGCIDLTRSSVGTTPEHEACFLITIKSTTGGHARRLRSGRPPARWAEHPREEADHACQGCALTARDPARRFGRVKGFPSLNPPPAWNDMSESIPPPTPPDLQFDRAVSAESGRPGGVTCARCGRTISDSYFHLGQRAFCSSCKATVEQAYATTLKPGSFVKAFVFGLGSAIAGAIVYYAVIAITNLEIGIVAILIGYMVGYAIRKATRGAGARRYQILGAALTYFAVALAYVPLAIKGAAEARKTGAPPTHAVARESAAAR